MYTRSTINMSDINHPHRYNQKNMPFECIDLVQHMPFLEGNIVKYVWRYKEKNGIADLKKALWYCKRAIATHLYVPDGVAEQLLHILVDKYANDKTTTGKRVGAIYKALYFGQLYEVKKALLELISIVKQAGTQK